MPIVISDYDPDWPRQFAEAAEPIRAALGDTALAIDHIGSTSVPGLAAKDIIDIQVTVAELVPSIADPLVAAGYSIHEFQHDHMPPGMDLEPAELAKRVLSGPAHERRVNVHIRQRGRFNQRYALLFRDYLRVNPEAAAAYERIKRVLAEWFPDDVDRYYAIKDPAVDLIMAGARFGFDRSRLRSS